ncbi:MAG: hypothetical protein KJO50_01785, partial [Bacteroidia bacterium]|nr:hypothetical protein [Bacteroidia bacterium]
RNDNFWIGLMVGATIPVIGFWLIEQGFNLLGQMDIIDDVTTSTSGRRQRTIALLAIACNLPIVQFVRSRKYEALIRGILVASFIYCGFWIFHYYGVLFS